ncbi:MAG: FecR domain-containing protein [Verrucomicrobia bacterium]|nr:FecR domain-containing protein [Verrucomicrobiota bacterium]
MNPDSHDLIQRHMAGLLTEDEAAVLQTRLKADTDLRRLYLHYMNLDVALEAQAGSRDRVIDLLRAAPLPENKPAGRWVSWRPLTAAAALLIFSAVAAWMMSDLSRGTARPFAVLAAANEAVWADPNVELALRGGELPLGALRLVSGTAEFLCADGATVVMRGPAVMRFAERKRVFVESGRIFCRCPSPESRLSVETASTEVVDLGTEFAVDARADRSTLVAVLSGEVQVGKRQPRFLRQGEAVEVRGDGILIIKPLAREEFAELLRASPSVSEAVLHGENVLRDAGFGNGLSEATWSGTEGNIEAVRSGGRSGRAVRVFAGGYALWPQCLQRIERGDIAGKLLVASVWAASPAQDRLRDGQFAMLKVAFINDQGREFAFSRRHVLDGGHTGGRFEQVQLAALVPPGTRGVLFQLVLTSRGFDSGSVVFDDAALILTDAPAAE